MIRLCIFLIVTIFIPLPSDQHFIWPVDMCVLADMCNHTWIPECGLERDEDYYRLFLDECDMYEYSCDNYLYFEMRNYSECFGQGPCPPMKCPPTSPCPSHRRIHGRDAGFLFYRRFQDAPTQATTLPNLPQHMLRGKRRYTRHKYTYKTTQRIEPFPRNILDFLKRQIQSQTTANPKPSPRRQPKKNIKTKPRLILKNTAKKTSATRAMTKSQGTTASRVITQLSRSMWETKIIKTSIFMRNGMRVMKVFKSINLGFKRTTKEMSTDDSDYLE